LLTAWKFPRSLIQPIAMHHLSAEKISRLAPDMVTEVSTLALANRLAHALLLGSSGNHCQYFTHEFAKILELTPDAMIFIEQQIPRQTLDMKNAMLQSGARDGYLEYRQLALENFHRPLRPLYVSTSAETDGYRILLERLKDTAPDERPNIAVMNLKDAIELESLTRQLEEREKRMGIKTLPLIIVSATTRLGPESKILGGRKHEMILAPFTLSRLADATNRLIQSEEDFPIAL
jgi:hypothetical protein